jgi:predicted O-linked N-acetylglucosamine transferase (SPINDLY family)
MGVPVVTCPGNTFAGRHSTSYLSSAGLTEFVAADLAGYIDLAVSWAKRVDELGDLRGTLRERVAASPIADAKQFAQDLVNMISQACVARQA